MNIESQKLLQTLTRMARLYSVLEESLVAEGLAMEHVDVLALGEVTQAKEALLSEIWAAEQARVEQATALAETLGIHDPNPTLSQMSARLPVDAREQISAAQRALAELLDRCRERNQGNMALASSALERIETMKSNILGRNGNNAENYNAQGGRNPINEHGGRLLSERA